MRNIFISFVYVLLAIMLYGCDSKKNTKSITNEQFSFDVSSLELLNNSVAEEGTIFLESDTSKIGEVPLTVGDTQPNVDFFLSELFSDNDYTLLSDPLNVNHRNIYFAVHYINNSLEICDVIVGYEIVDGIFHRYLLIKDFKFINEDGSVFSDFSEGYHGIYGFKIWYSYPKNPKYNPGLVIDTYFDKGNRIADGFTISWNEGNRQFEKQNFF
jgi:hypothetical protein